MYITFNLGKCQQGNTISEDLRTVTHTGGWKDASMLGSCAMSRGYHVWRVQIVQRDSMDVAVGLAEKPGLTVQERNIESSYSWWGKNGRKCVKGE